MRFFKNNLYRQVAGHFEKNKLNFTNYLLITNDLVTFNSLLSSRILANK